MRKMIGAFAMAAYIVFSSHTIFESTLSEKNCYHEGVSSITLEDGSILVSSSVNCSGNSSGWMAYLTHFDKNGDTLSSKKGMPFNGIMKLAQDGNLVFAGGNRAGFVYDTAKIFKTTLSGEMIWEMNLFPNLCKQTIHDILPTEDGFLVCGIYADGACNSSLFDSYIAKLGKEGNVIWEYKVTGPGNDQIHAVKKLNDGSIAAFGWTNSNINDADYLLMKLNEDGQLIWSKTYGDDGDNFGFGMDITQDNGFVVNGYSETMNAMRLDADGKITWSVGLSESCGGRYYKVKSVSENKFVFIGSVPGNGTSCNTALIELDKEGNFVWKKIYNGVMRDLQVLNSDSYLMTGYSGYPSMTYLVRFDTVQSPIVEENTNILLNVKSIKDENNESIKVFPNPSKSNVTIEFNNPYQTTFHLEVYNMDGKLVFVNDKVNSGKIELDNRNLSKGLYTFLLIGNGSVKNGKFMLQ